MKWSGYFRVLIYSIKINFIADILNKYICNYNQKFTTYGFKHIIYPQVLGTYHLFQNKWISNPHHSHYTGNINHYHNALIHAMDIILHYQNYYIHSCLIIFSDGVQATDLVYPQMWNMFKSWMAAHPRNKCVCSICVWVGNGSIHSNFNNLCTQIGAKKITTNNPWYGSQQLAAEIIKRALVYPCHC